MTQPVIVTIINATNWRDNLPQLGALLNGAAANGLSTISDPVGAPPDPEGLATVIDPTYWAGHQTEFAEILAGGSGAQVSQSPASVSGAADDVKD